MFTSIAKLRASSAMQSRVTTVENWLKRQMGAAYTPEVKFPIAFIAHSNSVEDVSWVNGYTNTHVAWPELADAVLKEFGHKTQGEHRSAMYEMLDARSPGKNKVLAETIVPKYNAAFASLGKTADFGSQPWAFKIEPQVAAPAVEANVAAVAANVPAVEAKETPQVEVHPTAAGAATDVFKPLAQVAAESAAANTEANLQVVGAMYVGLGKVMIDKKKTLAEAAKWSTSPTGGRIFSEYVHAFTSGVELKDVRAALKDFAATL
jgi:hypothetical protein